MKVSIITVDYNNPDVTLKLLASLEKLSLHNEIEVVVVDNGSKVNARKLITTSYPWVKFIRSEENLGFAGGNNLGIEESQGEYLFFINNDTELKEDIITPMINTLQDQPKIGMLCPEIRYFDYPEVIQYTGFTSMNKITGRNKCITKPTEGDLGLHETSFPHGAAMMVPRKVIEEVGGMPENFFLYYEEHDWAEMIRRAGYQIAVLRDCKIFHKESMSVGKINELKMYFMTRNRLLFMRRNYGGNQLVLFWLFFFFVALPKNVLLLMLRNDWSNINAFFAGIQWNFSSPVNSQRIGYKFDYLKIA